MEHDSQPKVYCVHVSCRLVSTGRISISIGFVSVKKDYVVPRLGVWRVRLYQSCRRSVDSSNDGLAFGDFDGDGKTDVLLLKSFKPLLFVISARPYPRLCAIISPIDSGTSLSTSLWKRSLEGLLTGYPKLFK
jgi:hypothetical protein